MMLRASPLFCYGLVALALCHFIPLISAREIIDPNFVEYGDVTEDYPYYHDGGPPICAPTDDVGSGNCLDPTEFILNEFVVAGVNLASYNDNPRAVEVPPPTRFQPTVRPFPLFPDFDISDMLRGNETWMELILIRRHLQRPSLTFYSDKVARKRWLGERGYPQPRMYFAAYADQLQEDYQHHKEELAAQILPHLPTTHGFAAKPNHMSMAMGAWLVDIDPKQPDAETKFTRVAKQLKSDQEYDPKECAKSLAHGLLREAATIESWALKQIRPGIVIEELYTNHLDRTLPPHEFCIFVIWGKVYVGQWNSVEVTDRYLDGFIYRDGTAAKGCDYMEPRVPDWVPWKDMVMVAESLSTGKDLFRVDFLVGVPRYSPPGTPPQFVISEQAIHPNTMFCNKMLADEIARLWVAGYKIGNYRVMDYNPEVPGDFVTKTGLTI